MCRAVELFEKNGEVRIHIIGFNGEEQWWTANRPLKRVEK